MPLNNMRTFSVLFNSSTAVRNVRGSPQGNIKYNVTSRYRSQSLSPVRDPNAPPPLQPAPFGPPEEVTKRVRQPPAMAYSTRAASYDPNAVRANPVRDLPSGLDQPVRMPFENSLRRYKRIENKRPSKPNLGFAQPAPVPVCAEEAEEAVREAAAPEPSPADVPGVGPSAAMARASGERGGERRGTELPSLGSLRMRTPRSNPRDNPTRFLPAPMTTVRVISTTNPAPPEAAQLPLGHPLNQPRLKPNLTAISHSKRARSPPDRSS